MSQARALSKAAMLFAIFATIVASGGAREARATEGEPPRAGSAVVATPESRAVAKQTVKEPRLPLFLVNPPDTKAARDALLVYPARETSAPRTASPLVLLHGMCDEPENECPWFAGPATDNRAVICPRATLSCSGGGALWPGHSAARGAAIEGTLSRIEHAAPAGLDSAEKPTLVGFSLGALVALDVAERSPGRFRALLLIGARVEPSASRLRAAGIESVLLAAGDHDMTKPHMEAVARRLVQHGIHARFESLGNVGHGFAPDMDKWLARSLPFLDEKAAPIDTQTALR